MSDIAMVVGSSGGFGEVISQALIQSGWSVLGADLISPKGDLVSDERFTFVQCDVTDRQSLTELVSGNFVGGSSLKAVIYCAGVYDHFPLAEAHPGRLESVIDVNVLGFARVVHATFEAVMQATGRYVVISSETALASLPFQVYGTSKRMLEVYTDALYQELQLVGIPVITIRPGAHDTGLLAKSREKLGQIRSHSKFRKQMEIVRKHGHGIIDQGAKQPSAIIPVIMRALTDRKPKRVYHLNVASHFKMLNAMPAALVRRLFKLILGES